MRVGGQEADVRRRAGRRPASFCSNLCESGLTRTGGAEGEKSFPTTLA